MYCKKCGKEMRLEMVTEKKKRGFGKILLIFLGVITCGILFLIFPLLKNNETTKTYFVCDHCGNVVYNEKIR